jgi:hypothetical protein
MAAGSVAAPFKASGAAPTVVLRRIRYYHYYHPLFDYLHQDQAKQRGPMIDLIALKGVREREMAEGSSVCSTKLDYQELNSAGEHQVCNSRHEFAA